VPADLTSVISMMTTSVSRAAGLEGRHALLSVRIAEETKL
jgi:hypothetical protein